MKIKFFKIKAIYLCVVLVCLFATSCTSTRPKSNGFGMPKLSTLDSFSPKKAEEWTLKNGLKILYLRDDSLPLVNISLNFRGGSLWEDKEAYGNSQFLGSAMRNGGAGKYSPDEFDRQLEEKAASISASLGEYLGSVSMTSLRAEYEDVFKLFSDVIFRPKFDLARLNLAKSQTLESIDRKKDSPVSIAYKKFLELTYGNNSLGWTLTKSDVKRVTRKSIKKAYLKFIRPQNAIMTITGKISKDEVDKLLESEFLHWLPSKEELEVPNINLPQIKPKLVFIEGDFSQSTVLLGHLGVPLYTPDHFEIKIFNEIFGSGGLSSRLYSKIRTDKGLAYSVYGSISPGIVRGLNKVILQTKSASTGDALATAIDVLQGLIKVEPTADEVETSRLGLVNSFVFSHDSTGKIVGREAIKQLSGYPDDYDERYVEKVNDVSASDVKNVAKIRWEPDSFTIVIVGNKEAYKSFLESGGRLPKSLASLPVTKLTIKDVLAE